jgi:uncharacterized membrane-anchored protein
MRRRAEARRAPRLAGALLLLALGAALPADGGADPGLSPTAAEAAAAATPDAAAAPSPELAAAANPAPAAAPTPGPVMVVPQVGPLSLSLGAQAVLQLGDGWRWVDQGELKAYLAPSGRRAGPWDLGLALSPGDDPQEFRLQFEPMGAVADGPPDALAPEALMGRLQGMAVARRKKGQPELAINGWALTPALEMDGQRLVWAEHRQSEGEERLGWHGRFRLRNGVLKLDVSMSAERWEALGPQARALFEGLSAQPGQAWADRAASDRPAALDLPNLVVDGVFGRGSLVGGAPDDGGEGVGSSVALWSALGLGLITLALGAWRRLKAWRLQRIKERLDEARLAQLEKDFGGRAEDVEEIVDEDEDRKR